MGTILTASAPSFFSCWAMASMCSERETRQENHLTCAPRSRLSLIMRFMNEASPPVHHSSEV